MARDDVAPWYRQFWFWFVFAPPLAAIVIGLSLLATAVIYGDSLVTDNYETVGRAIHKTYQLEHEAVARGVDGNMVLDREGGQVTVRLDGPEDLPETLRLYLSHPTHAERDVALELQRDSSGLYRGEAFRSLDGRHYMRLQPADGSWMLAKEIAADERELALTPAPRGG